MNGTATSTEKELVKKACIDITSRKSNSDSFVRVKQVRDHELILDHYASDRTDQYRHRSVANVLHNIEWAEKWSRGTYRVEL